MYSLTAPPIRIQKMFPGNIGEGISRQAAVKSEKNANRINKFFTPTPIMFYVYVLISTKDKNLYIGSTNDIKTRI